MDEILRNRTKNSKSSEIGFKSFKTKFNSRMISGINHLEARTSSHNVSDAKEVTFRSKSPVSGYDTPTRNYGDEYSKTDRDRTLVYEDDEESFRQILVTQPKTPNYETQNRMDDYFYNRLRARKGGDKYSKDERYSHVTGSSSFNMPIKQLNSDNNSKWRSYLNTNESREYNNKLESEHALNKQDNERYNCTSSLEIVQCRKIDEYVKLVGELESEILSLKKLLNEMNHTNEDLEIELIEKQKKITELEIENKQIKLYSKENEESKEIESTLEVNGKFKELIEQSKILNLQIKKLESELGATRENLDKTTKDKIELAKQNNILISVAPKSSGMDSILEEYSQNLVNSRKELEDKEVNFLKLSTDLSKMGEENSKLQDILNLNKEKYKRELESLVSKHKSDIEHVKKTAEKQLQQLTKKNEEVLEELMELKKSQRKMSMENHDVVCELQTVVRSKDNDLRISVIELDSANSKIELLERKNEELQKSLNIKDKLSHTNVFSLRHEMSDLDLSVTEKDILLELRKENSLLKSQIDKLKSSGLKDSLKIEKDSTESKLRKELEETKSTHEEKVRRMSEFSENLLQEIDLLSNKLKTKEDQQKLGESTLKSVREENKLLKSLIEKIEKKGLKEHREGKHYLSSKNLSSVLSQSACERKQQNIIRNEISIDIPSEIMTMQEDKDELICMMDSEIMILKQNIQELRSDVISLKSKLNEKDYTISFLNTVNKNLGDEVSNIKATISSKEAEIKNLKLSELEFQKQIKALKKTIGEKSSEIKNMYYF